MSSHFVVGVAVGALGYWAFMKFGRRAKPMA